MVGWTGVPKNKALSLLLQLKGLVFLNTPRRARTCDPLIKSPKLQPVDGAEPASCQQGQADESECKGVTESLENKGDSASAPVGESACEVQRGDCDVCSRGHGSDKQDDKRVIADPDLRQVVDTWADLPEAVKTGILAMVASQAK